MEVDNVHQLHHSIKMKLRKGEIYSPTDYFNVCRDSRSNNPYKAKYMNFSRFNDYSSLKYYTLIRPVKK
jgi:hypothetical protein